MKNLWKNLATVIVVTLFCLMAMGSSDTEEAKKIGEVLTTTTNAKQDVVNDQSETPAETESAEQQTSEKQEEQKSNYHVGDILEIDGLKITYVSSGEYVTDNQFLQPDENNKYIFIELAVENTSNSDKSISSFSFNCYADGYDCDSFYSGDNTLSASLSSGRTTIGKIYFEVPENAEKIEIEYDYSLLSNKKAIFIYDGIMQSDYVAEANISASENAFVVGDIVEGNGIKMSYLSCEKWESGNQFIVPKDGYSYIACEFEFENTGTSDQMISSFSFNCFADGASCDQSYSNDKDIGTVTLSAGRKAKGCVTFEVPDNASIVELEYTTSYFTSKHAIFKIR